jgi:hypothetical protein
MMREDVVIAITIFFAVMFVLAVVSYIGYDRWSDMVQ